MAAEALVLGILLLAAPAPGGQEGRASGEEAPVAEATRALALGREDLVRIDAALARRPDSAGLRLDRLRLLYVLAVKDRGLIPEGMTEIARMEPAAGEIADPQLLRAYGGALAVLGAKHSPWPARKLESLKAGLPALDSSVALRPDHAEIRYLRLVSSYYLPFFLGRKDSVRADFAALARLLPEAHRDYPARWYLGFSRFVLEKGRLGREERRALEARVVEVAAAAEATP